MAGEVRIDRGPLPVAVGSTGAAPDAAATVHVLLLGIDGPLDPNDARRGHRRFALRYLLLASEAEPLRAADLVATLLIAGLDHPDFDARAADCADPLWATLGIAPRPAVRLAVPWRVERSAAPAAAVREPIAVAFAQLGSLVGIVVGPDDLRIAGARVRLSGTGRVATTDGLGRFRFGASRPPTPRCGPKSPPAARRPASPPRCRTAIARSASRSTRRGPDFAPPEPLLPARTLPEDPWNT